MTRGVPWLLCAAVGFGAGFAAGCGASAAEQSDAGPMSAADSGPMTSPDAAVPATLCEERKLDALVDGQRAFTTPALRWSCHGTSGMGPSTEQQEYCEYFAVVAAPPPTAIDPAPPTTIHGRNLGPDETFGQTSKGMALTSFQISQLESNPDDIVGQCVFSAWNSDDETPCQGTCAGVLGLAQDAENFRMRFDVNSIYAAVLLVDDCLYGFPDAVGDLSDPTDPKNDDFLRGCLLNQDINDTAHRKSDTDICAAAMRLGECNCWAGDPIPEEDVLPEILARSGYPGFPLGTWSGFIAGDEGTSALPSGCRYLSFGDNSQRVVTCDIHANALLSNSADLERYCRDAYSDNIVVHVPVPGGELACDPIAEVPYSGTCDSEPWVLD